jgi:hypothetical protein
VEGALVIVTRAASRLQYGREIEKFTNLRAYVMRPASKMTKKSKSLDDYVHEQAYMPEREWSSSWRGLG